MLTGCQEQTGGHAGSPLSPDRPLDVPKELYLLLDKLQREGVTCADLFEQPGLHTEVQQIRDALDTGQAQLRIRTSRNASKIVMYWYSLQWVPLFLK